jgi:acyl-CoA thioesterase-1
VDISLVVPLLLLLDTTAPATAGPPTVVFLGDSLTAGLGLPSEEAFPAVLSRELAKAGHPIRAVNAGVSGDTSAGGLRRVDWLMKQKPAVVVVALGANDGLRGQPASELERNLGEIVRKARAAGARVLLCGMLVPTNYGPEYGKSFSAVYPKVSKDLKVPLVPFLLEGVAGEARLNQADGIHPTAEGQRRIAATVRKHLEPLLGTTPR